LSKSTQKPIGRKGIAESDMIAAGPPKDGPAAEWISPSRKGDTNK